MVRKKKRSSGAECKEENVRGKLLWSGQPIIVPIHRPCAHHASSGDDNKTNEMPSVQTLVTVSSLGAYLDRYGSITCFVH